MSEKYLEKVRFLIIEDTVFIRELVRRILAVFGAVEIREAGDGTSAMRLLDGFDPDIIILDWEMRPMDGLTFVKEVRQGKAGPGTMIPIIMLSAYSEKERVVAARDAGVNEFVVKPFTANRLVNRIQSVIDRPRKFIKCEAYFGPDRRRRNVGPPAGTKDRRPAGSKKAVEHAADAGEV